MRFNTMPYIPEEERDFFFRRCLPNFRIASDTTKVGFKVNRLFYPIWSKSVEDFYYCHNLSVGSSSRLSYIKLKRGLEYLSRAKQLTSVIRKGQGIDIYFGYGFIARWEGQRKKYLLIKAINSYLNEDVKEPFRFYLSSELFTNEVFSIFHRRLMEKIIIPSKQPFVVHSDIDSLFFDEINLVKFKSFHAQQAAVSELLSTE